MAQTPLSQSTASPMPRDVARWGRAGRAIIAGLFGPPPRRPFAVRYWDGGLETPADQPAPAFTLVIRRPGALRRMFLPPSELALGEAFVDNDVDVEGDLEAAVRQLMALVGRLRPGLFARLLPMLLALPTDDLDESSHDAASDRTVTGRLHSRRRDAAAVSHHYDVGNDFYQLWLDPRLVYTCAYFPTGQEDLATAQAAKLDLICRKLRLKPGERLLDIGCGWGSFIQFAAERSGVDATGITLSREQAALARERIAAAGLTSRCRVELVDYRDFTPRQPFDKVVSIGMFEQVGRREMDTYFRRAYSFTRPGGLFLNHGITETFPKQWDESFHWAIRPFWQKNAFLNRYVFPDGDLISAGAVLTAGENAGFEVWDVENLREHYTLTLRHWVRRLEAKQAEATKLIGEHRYRVWRLYLAAAAESFRAGRNSLIQALFTRPASDGRCELPPTRDDLYRPAAG